jgi:hypothetical protein
MPGDTYPIEFDEKTGRAFVDVTQAINADKIRNTFLYIVGNKDWHYGDRSILWQCEKATFPSSFKFSDVFDTTRTTSLVAGKGKSAVLLPAKNGTAMLIAEFYQSISATKTGRMIKIFDSREKALAWLDS